MSLADCMKLGGVLVFIVGMLAIAVRLLWWVMDMDAICNMFDEGRGE